MFNIILIKPAKERISCLSSVGQPSIAGTKYLKHSTNKEENIF
jgi:hypothetical protein